MNKIKIIIVFLFSFLSIAQAYDNMEQLLSEYSEKADLSNETKIETSGSIIIFTRKDLDRMKVKSLNELLELIPFLRYNIDNYGFTDPFFSVFELNTSQLIKLYINDREVYTPLTKSSLKITSMLDLEYIDHIEIYLGMSSFSKDTSSSITTIKMYTKEPEREDINVIGTSMDDLFSTELYAYSSHSLKYFSYLLSFDYRDTKNKTFKYHDNDINRDHNFYDVYAQINFKQNRFEAQAIRIYNDIFLGSNTNKTPSDDSYTSIDYFYGGWFYNSKDKLTNIHLYLTYGKNELYEKGKHVMILPIPHLIFPITFFNKRKITQDETLIDFNVSHNFVFNKHEILLGFKTKYKKFNTLKSEFNDKDYNIDTNYDTEISPGVFLEYTLKFTKQDTVKALLKYEKNYENGNIRDYEDVEARLGYIKYFKPFGFKAFVSYTKYSPAPFHLYYNKNVNDYLQINDLKESSNKALSAEILYYHNGLNASFMIAKDMYENTIYFDGIKYVTDKYTTKANQYYLNLNKDIFIAHKLRMNAFLTEGDFSGGFEKVYARFYGGYIGLLGSFSKFEHSEILTYRDGNYDNDYGINLNISLSYFLTKKLTIYFKGINLLDKALKTDYYKADFMGNIEWIDDVNILDRRIMAGLEWQF